MGRSLKDHLTQCKADAEIIYGQCVEVSGERHGYLCILPFLMALCKSKQTRADRGLGNNGSGSGTLIGMLTLSVPTGRLSFLLWPLACPPADTLGHFLCVSTHRYIQSSCWVFTTTRWFLLICFLSGQGDGRVLWWVCVGAGGRWRWVKHSHMQPESPVWQIAPGLDFFLHWADVVSHLFSLVIIPH